MASPRTTLPLMLEPLAAATMDVATATELLTATVLAMPAADAMLTEFAKAAVPLHVPIATLLSTLMLDHAPTPTTTALLPVRPAPAECPNKTWQLP